MSTLKGRVDLIPAGKRGISLTSIVARMINLNERQKSFKIKQKKKTSKSNCYKSGDDRWMQSRGADSR